MYPGLVIPEGYKPALDVLQTEKAIKQIKDYFQNSLARALNLQRVTSPVIVKSGLGINDDLSGRERPVSFVVAGLSGLKAEIVQSLAKWKRLTLARLKIPPGEGIYTDMNAVRPDEIPDNLHSIYVDQWDWERSISPGDRDLGFLRGIVRKIYSVIRRTELYVCRNYPVIRPILPPNIHFIHALELEKAYPERSPEEREDEICRSRGAVFIQGIGAPLQNGRPHDVRAPDYDDWITATEKGPGLNGDILVWFPLLNRAMEISSMGIRVDPASLLEQLRLNGTKERASLYFHRRLLEGKLPLSVGGGIGQSRLCMFFLKKAHIGEVQAGIWDEETIDRCRRKGIFLL